MRAAFLEPFLLGFAIGCATSGLILAVLLTVGGGA